MASYNTAELEKFERLYQILKDPGQKAIYEKWITHGMPKKSTGILFLFLKDNFGLKVGNNDLFKSIVQQFNVYLENRHRQGPPQPPEPQPEPETIEQRNARILNLINTKQLFEIKDGKYTHSEDIKKLIKWYKRNDGHLPDVIKQYIKINLQKFIEAKYDITKGKYIDSASEMLMQLSKKLKQLEYLIKFPRNELERKKAIEMKKDIEEQMKKYYMMQYYKDLKTGDKLHYVEPAQLNSYVPNKFIPLYVKNKGLPGYHRITGEEIALLKQDPSGQYYDGNGIEDIFNKFKLPNKLDNKNSIKPFFSDPSNILFKLNFKGGSIIGFPYFPHPVIKPDIKPVIKPDLRPFVKPVVKPVDNPVVKPDLGPFIKPVIRPLDTPERPIVKHLSGTGGTYINTNYKPQMIMKPFSIGW